MKMSCDYTRRHKPTYSSYQRRSNCHSLASAAKLESGHESVKGQSKPVFSDDESSQVHQQKRQEQQWQVDSHQDVWNLPPLHDQERNHLGPSPSRREHCGNGKRFRCSPSPEYSRGRRDYPRDERDFFYNHQRTPARQSQLISNSFSNNDTGTGTNPSEEQKLALAAGNGNNPRSFRCRDFNRRRSNSGAGTRYNHNYAYDYPVHDNPNPSSSCSPARSSSGDGKFSPWSPNHYHSASSHPPPQSDQRKCYDSIVSDIEPAPLNTGHELGHIYGTTSHGVKYRQDHPSHYAYSTRCTYGHSHSNKPEHTSHDRSINSFPFSSPSDIQIENTPQTHKMGHSSFFVSPASTDDSSPPSRCREDFDSLLSPSSEQRRRRFFNSSPHRPEEHNHSGVVEQYYDETLSEGGAGSRGPAHEPESDLALPVERKRFHSNAWFGRLEELKAYKEKYGDCMVPQKFKENPSLGIWVNKQRMEYKLLQDGQKSSMSTDRLSALRSIGFIWAKRKGQATWDAKYLQLKEYASIHGDCLIPTKYSKDPALGRWVSTQREQYKLFKNGDPKSKMTKEKVKLLEKVGFVWRLQF